MLAAHSTSGLQSWLDALGYAEAGLDLLTSVDAVSAEEAFAPELLALLDGSIDPAIGAVAAVDHTPTVCFVALDPNAPGQADRIAAIRRAVWNQNLVCLVLAVTPDTAYPYPVAPDLAAAQPIQRGDTNAATAYGYRGLAAGALLEEHPDWFDRKHRVDRRLLRNLDEAVVALKRPDESKLRAQYLLGQSLFIAYLEHRGIAGGDYRRKHCVDTLLALVRARNRERLEHYIACLKESFNGDILAPEIVGLAGWSDLDDNGLAVIADFLSHTDISTGQQSLWAYDFRYIPVELISGVYETFLADDKRLAGAYYTPRNLAAFAVDQAFEHSVDITREVVYDGACGSGILLVTAFRRMVHAADAAAGTPLTFAQRCQLLLGHIRGGDINPAACMVAAFSLYLSLLENLQPADLTRLGNGDHEARLPHLRDAILWSGARQGDFFGNDSGPQDATIFLSNPPWKEPRGEDQGLGYESWAEDPARRWFLPHRQIAAAFAHRALDVVPDGGRVCLILPAKLFLSATSQKFVLEFLSRCNLKRVVCLADVRHMLFSEAVHPCVIVLAERMSDERQDAGNPMFDYWVPKADVSVAYGRLTIHGCDRHQLPAGLVARNNQLLRTYLWGGPHDQALLLRLRALGRLDDMVSRGRRSESKPRWIEGKGFHHLDRNRDGKDAGFLRQVPFLDAKRTPSLPVLDPLLLQDLPQKFAVVASYGAHNGELFRGPRVMINDGVDYATYEAKAVFSQRTFSFQSSIGAFAGPDADADLLRFLAVYLRSSLARYLLLVSSYALTVERQRVSMTELKDLPFVPPEQHPDPARAKRIVGQIAAKSRAMENMDGLQSAEIYDAEKSAFDRLIAEYFGLNSIDQDAVDEAVRYFIPSIQPRWGDLGESPLLRTLSSDDLFAYASTLSRELRDLSVGLGGDGAVRAEVVAESTSRRGAIGICRILRSAGDGSTRRDDDQVASAIRWLRQQRLMPLAAGESFQLASDFLFFCNNEMFLVKPLVARFWLRGQARRDALRVVRAARQYAGKGTA